jgi:DNA mismatch repair protein MutL
VADLVSAYALAYPGVRFRLRIDGRSVLQTSGQGNLRDVALKVHGAEVARSLLALSDEPDEGPIRVSGLISPPQISRASRGDIRIFVNRRWIQSRRLTYAVEEAYQGLLTVGRHPIAIINLTAPYEDVDVNVHPTKAEVRFRDERAVFTAVQRSVRRTLLAEAPIPAMAPVAVEAGAGEVAPLTFTTPARTPHVAPAPAAKLVADGGHTDPSPPVLSAKIPLLRAVGQVSNTYIITEGPDGMYLIDQHAAHERVLYEQVRAARERQSVEVQGLLAAVVVEVSPTQAARLAEDSGSLRAFGFDIEAFGDRTWLLRAVPAVMAGRDPAASLRGFLDLLERPDGPRERDDRIAATIACHAAVRAGKVMTPDEMRELVHRLEGCEMPRTCPHGRPTMIHLSQSVLEREFRRR